MVKLKAPFPWFGGKSRVANLVWERFGDVPNYVEPFAGSLATLLGRPTAPRVETVNDLDCYLANFWRALAAAPETVAVAADWPVNEADLHARHRWLHKQTGFREKMRGDPEFFDAKIAGWWVWGLSCWIGDNWCRPNPQNSTPHLTGGGGGRASIAEQLPALTRGGGNRHPSGVPLTAHSCRHSLAQVMDRVVSGVACIRKNFRAMAQAWTRVDRISVRRAMVCMPR